MTNTQENKKCCGEPLGPAKEGTYYACTRPVPCSIHQQNQEKGWECGRCGKEIGADSVITGHICENQEKELSVSQKCQDEWKKEAAKDGPVWTHNLPENQDTSNIDLKTDVSREHLSQDKVSIENQESWENEFDDNR